MERESTAITMDTAAGFAERMGFTLGDDKAPPSQQQHNSQPRRNGQFDPVWFLNLHAVRILRQEPHEGGTKIVLEHCVFDESHKGKDACVFVRPDGKLGYKCLHDSCAGKTWRDVRQHLDPGCYDRQPATVQGQPRTEQQHAESISYRRITSAELDGGDFRQEFLIEGVMVAAQPMLGCGPQKTLKTSTFIDLAITLDTGGHFLGYFPATRKARVGIMSGESGLATIQETARRIARAAGHHLSDLGIIWSDSIPKFGSPNHGEAVERFIQHDGLEVLMIDPAYLAIPTGNEGSVFAQGDMLRGMSEICQRNGTALVLAHHTKKSRADQYAPPTLDEIAWAGFAEFARQWLLIGRREAYVPGTGEHRLWLSTGGSAGHGGLYGVDVSEGTQSDGRHWQVTVNSQTNLEVEREQQRESKQHAEIERSQDSLRTAFRSMGAGWHVKAHVFERTGTSGKGRAMSAAWAAMLRTGEIECQQGVCKGGNNRPCEGYRIRHES